MKKHQWSGKWPTDEYPPDGARIRFLSRGHQMEGVVLRCWCGCEPTLDVDVSGKQVSVFPSFDAFEIMAPPPAAEGETCCDLDPLANVNEMGTGNIK